MILPEFETEILTREALHNLHTYTVKSSTVFMCTVLCIGTLKHWTEAYKMK